MSVSDGQNVNAAVTNAAYLSKTTDSTTVAVLGLNKPSEGNQVVSTQKAINKAFEGIGTTGENDTTINDYANNNYIVDGDSRKVAIEKLDAALDVVQDQAATFNGDKTFNDDVIINGDLTVNGTQTILNTSIVESEDTNILINKGGNDASSEGAGFTVQRTTTNASMEYEDALASKFKIGLVGSLREIIVSGVAQTIAGAKTFTSAIAMSAQKITGLADPTDAQDAATQFYVDDAGGFTTIVGAAGTTTLTNSSNKKITVTGTLGQTIDLPDTTTLNGKEVFIILNNGTAGTVTVRNSAATTQAVLEIIHGLIIFPTNVAQTWTSMKIPRISTTTGNLNMGSGKIINLADPTNAQDAATKNYVDTSSGSSSFSDDVFEVKDNGDATKKFKVEVSSVATATTRTMTVPDVDFTPVTVASSQVVTGNKQFQDIAIITNPLDLNSGQIAFPSTANPSANANTLDDYEEGTWTPVDSSGAGLTFTDPSGVYTKIGNMVYWSAYFAFPVTASVATNLIGGLPFTVAAGDNNRAANVGYANKGVAFTLLHDPSSTSFRFYAFDGTTKINSELSNGSFYVSGFYRI